MTLVNKDLQEIFSSSKINKPYLDTTTQSSHPSELNDHRNPLHRLPRSFLLPKYPYSEYVLFVNCVVIVCLFTFLRLDDNESKENGSRSQPRNGDGDQSIKDEDEDYF
jgi:hypothetical protein